MRIPLSSPFQNGAVVPVEQGQGGGDPVDPIGGATMRVDGGELKFHVGIGGDGLENRGDDGGVGIDQAKILIQNIDLFLDAGV